MPFFTGDFIYPCPGSFIRWKRKSGKSWARTVDRPKSTVCRCQRKLCVRKATVFPKHFFGKLAFLSEGSLYRFDFSLRIFCPVSFTTLSSLRVIFKRKTRNHGYSYTGLHLSSYFRNFDEYVPKRLYQGRYRSNHKTRSKWIYFYS